MTSLDQLSIEIVASSAKASEAIDALCTKLGRLKTSLNSVSTKKLSNDLNKMSNQMNKFGNSARKASSDSSSSMAQLGSSLESIRGSLNKANNGLNNFFINLTRSSKETKNFAQQVGLLYARFFLLIRGVKKLGSAIKSSMSYIETLNYFDSAFGQVAESAIESWQEIGEQSAQEYANSFKEEAKQVTAEMTGWLPDASGMLQKVGTKSLGLDSNVLMRYQAQFAQMANSMGVTSKSATKLSEVLVKIGADLASVKDMDFESVWGDMASGLVGMSRTLDKYGVNIRNVNMQQKLNELGIDATVASLNQQDKALLRTIILLDSTKYAWGDLAETLDSEEITNWRVA